MIILNLGCGNDIRPECINVDFRATHPSVIVMDLSTTPWSFADEYADEILMLDFLEHFSFRMTHKILWECQRILKPNGKLVIQVPDAEHVCKAMLQIDQYRCNKCSHKIVVKSDDHGSMQCDNCGQTRDWCSEEAMRRLFGGQDYPGNFHHTCFTLQSLTNKLNELGFKNVVEEEHYHQYVNWNIKVSAIKGDIW